MMHIFQAFVLGIIEGITEFLPISSTAHLILTSQVLGIPQTGFQKSFEIIIQLGAILSVVVVYWRMFLNIAVLKRLVVSFIPTGVIGLALYSFVKNYLLESTSVILWSLFLGGITMIVFEHFYKKSDEEAKDITTISYTHCLLIGVFQSVALIPGVSRAAATIIGGRIFGLTRKSIVEFSFLLAVPTMLAATGFDLLKNYREFAGSQLGYLSVGFIVSFVVALVSIKFLLRYIKRHDFKVFGIYRIVLAVVFWFWIK